MSMILGCCCSSDLCDDYGLLIVEPKWYINTPVYPTPSLDFWISSSTGYLGATVGISGGWTGIVAGLTCDTLGISFGQYMPAEWQNWETKFLGTHHKGTYYYPGNLEGRDTGNSHYELRSTLILPSKYSQYEIENKIVNVGNLFNNKNIPFTDLAIAYEQVARDSNIANHHAWMQINTTGVTAVFLPNVPFCDLCSPTTYYPDIEHNILPGKADDYASHTFTINNIQFTDNLPVSTPTSSIDPPRHYDIFYTIKQDVPIDTSLRNISYAACRYEYCNGVTLDRRCTKYAVRDETNRCCAEFAEITSDDLTPNILISQANFQNGYKFFLFRVKLQKENIPKSNQIKIVLQNTYYNGVFGFNYVVPKRTEECTAKCTEYNNQIARQFEPLEVIFSPYYYYNSLPGQGSYPVYDWPDKDRCYTKLDLTFSWGFYSRIVYDCSPFRYFMDQLGFGACYFADISPVVYLDFNKRRPVYGEICKETESTVIKTPAFPPCDPSTYTYEEIKQPPKILKLDATESTQFEYNPILMYTGNINYTDNKTPNFQKYLKYKLNVLKQEFPIIPDPDPYYPGSTYNRDYILVTENPQCTYFKMNHYKYSSLTNLKFISSVGNARLDIKFHPDNITEFTLKCMNVLQYRQDLQSMGLFYKNFNTDQSWNNLKSFYGYTIASTAAGITYEKLNNLVLNKSDNIYSYGFLKNNLNIKLP